MSMVRFEDVATRVNTKEDRHNTDLEYYVGGEHIETNELKVSGRGIIKGAPLGPMFYFGFKSGDILFVTRNPHLRKSAMVDFSGICSEKTLVVATKDENVLSQKYLAAVMQSDDFWDFMEENKSGSVNYFINWSTLAEYEFDLPPIEEQRKLAEKLWAANDLKEKYKAILASTDEMLKAKFREMFGECGEQSSECGRNKKWKDVLTICNGKAHKEDYLSDGPYKIMGSGGLMGYSNTYLCEADTVIIGRKGNINNPIYMSTKYWIVDTAFCLIPNRKILDARFLFYWCCQFDFNQFNKQCVLPSLTKNDIYEININIPPITLQREFLAIAEQAEATKAALKKSIADIEAVMKGLING